MLTAMLASLHCALGPPIAPARAPAPLPDLSHVEHFGFAIVDAYHDDPHDHEQQSVYTAEVASFSTMADLAVFLLDDSLTPRIDAMLALGVRPMLSIQHVLFETLPDTASPSGYRVSLRPDAGVRLSVLVQANSLDTRQADIAAIYLVDEPTWNGLSADDLMIASDLVQAALPDVPCVVIEAWPVVDALIVPESIDWIGFDRYTVFDPSTDRAWQNDLATLLSRRSSPHQRVVVVMESQWLPAYGDLGVSPGMMGLVARNYARAAAQCPETIAIIGYTWPGGFEPAEQLGARNLPPQAQRWYRWIGSSVMGNR